MREKVNFGYSIKNIPIPPERTYLLQLMEKVEMVITRMRWKAIHFNNNDSRDNIKEENTEWYGLKSPYSPRQVKELIPFENDLVELIRNIKFRKIRNTFQGKLKEDIKLFKKSNKTMPFADKTSNMYRLTKEEYDQLIMNSITSTYKKANNNIKKQINMTRKNLMRDKEVIKQMEKNEEGNSFITIKDHKENFDNHPTARLINPAKNELGRISKLILDKINKKISQKSELNQWKNTDVVTDWFKQIKNKNLYKFATFDIKEFYPSIKECLLKNAINFAEQHTEISEKDKAIIFDARKSLLFNGQHVWIKEEGRLFDVTMGAFDGAEVCEAVGKFLLYQHSKNYNKKHIGLYRDDGIFKNVSGSKVEKIKKDIHKLFKDNQLNITIQCNLKIVNYLDVTPNLSNATYRPFCKTNNDITYIHKESNHPPSILRQIPLSIESRLSKHSSNEKVFKESAQIYQEALKKSGYDHQLIYQKSVNNKNEGNKRRKRKIIWFNPPYSKNVLTKVGNQFLKLINKHFPRHRKLYKLFNENNVTESYSCMPNIKNIINTHNKKIINPPKDNITRTCNCIRKHQCSLKEKCLTNNVLYKASITPNEESCKTKIYYGVSETAFKLRYANHKKTFNNIKYQTDTELSNEYWNIISANKTSNISWKILGTYKSYNQSSKRCLLCLNEKLAIALHGGDNMLKKYPK